MVKKVPKLVNVVCERPLIANKIRKNKPFSVKFCLQTLIKFESQLTPCLQPLPSPITKWIKTNKKIITIKTMTITIMVWFIRYFHQSGIPNLRNLLINWQTEKTHTSFEPNESFLSFSTAQTKKNLSEKNRETNW